MSTAHHSARGFTLVEMLVIAPIVIIAIGAFIAAIVSLTGEVLSSRGSNVLSYDTQSALNQIEEDVKLSVGFLATNNKDVNVTSTGINNGTSPFTNTGTTPNNQALILNAIVTTGNPASSAATALYLNNQPGNCASMSPAEYAKNAPMTMNIVYYTQTESNGEISLWRRVILQSTYNNSATYCGTTGPWQRPSCNPYPGATAHCTTKDARLVTGIDPAGGFLTEYFSAANNTIPTSGALDANEATRQAALASSTTVNITLKAKRTIAGRDISRTSVLRVSRLDTNASTISYTPAVTGHPAAPVVSASVADGRKVTFSWPRSDGATSYEMRYRVQDAVTAAWGGWTSWAVTTTPNQVVSSANHGDTIQAEVVAKNGYPTGSPPVATKSFKIPVWAPLALGADWQDYANGYSPASYTRTKSGLVMLRGLIKKSTAATVGETLGSLPYEYRPIGGRLMFGTTTSGNASARIDITANGDVIFSDGGSAAWYSLETVRYLAYDSGYTRTTPALLNGFGNYGNGYAPASYAQDSSGRVDIQGLLTTGTLTNGTTIFSIPAALRPAKYQHHASRSGAFHHLGIDNANGLLAKGDGSGAYSINSNYLPASYSGWTNLTMVNGWVSYDGGTQFSTPQYTKTNDNVVALKGLIKSGGGYDTVIATLPAGFRPKNRILYTTANAGVHGRIDVLANGEVRFMGSTNTWYALDDVMFLAEQ